MNDAQSTVAGLKAQDCPGGGGATVADCLAGGVCGCIYGDAVQHIERLRAALKEIANCDGATGLAGSLVETAKAALGVQQSSVGSKE
jgi:hypothetical protein